MSRELLDFLQRQHAFDPAPVRGDLGVYHVPFAELVGDAHPESGLLEACLRCERIAIVGDSGAGKSSLTARVLGPLAEGVAPVLVPIARESFDVVREPRAMFAHLVSVIAAHAADAEVLSQPDRERMLAQVASDRPVGRAGGRSGRLSLTWMGIGLGADLARQAGPAATLDRSATETLEILHQMVEIIRAQSLIPVLVFDDTDRWLRGHAYPEPEALVGGFFGRVLPELSALRCALVVAVHRNYLNDDQTRSLIDRTLETRVDVPSLKSAKAIAAVLESRVRVHRPGNAPAPLDDVITGPAVERLFEHYSYRLRGELRAVLRTAHTALAEACDNDAEVSSLPS